MGYFRSCMNRFLTHLSPRWPALVLMVLMIFQALGWTLAWQAARREAHFAAQQAVTQVHTPLQALTLSMADLAQSRVGKKEIVHGGRLYDIKVAKQIGDSVYLMLYHDQHEQHLYRLLGEILCSTPDASSPASAPVLWLAQWLSAAYLMPSIEAFCLEDSLQGRCAFSAPLTLRMQRQPGCDTPPPDFG